MSDGSHDGSWKEDSLGFLSASADAVEGCLPTQSTAQIALLLLGMWTMMKGMLSAHMVHCGFYGEITSECGASALPRAASQWRRGAAALLLALLPRDWRVRPPCLSVPLLCGGGRVHAVRQDTRWTDARACPAAWTRRREGVAGLRSRRSPSTARPSTCVLWRRRTTPPLAGAEAEAENDLFTNRAGCGTAPAAAATRTAAAAPTLVQAENAWQPRRARNSPLSTYTTHFITPSIL